MLTIVHSRRKTHLLPYSVTVNLDTSLLENWNNGSECKSPLHCIHAIYMIYDSVEQFTDLYFIFLGVQAQQLEIAVRMDGSTFFFFFF